MPLVDDSTQKIEFDDGDFYIIREVLGFYERTRVDLGGISLKDALAVRDSQKKSEKRGESPPPLPS